MAELVEILFRNVVALQLFAGLGYLFGTTLIAKNNILGWPIKIVGGVAWVIFLIENNNTLFGVVTMITVTTMIYGWHKWHQEIFDQITPIDKFFTALTGVTILAVIVMLIASGNYTAGTGLETIIVIAEILGTVLLARKRVVGWYLYILMSLCVVLLITFVNTHSAPILGLLELMLLGVYIKGIKTMKHLEPENRL